MEQCPFGSKTRRFSTDDAKTGHLTSSRASSMYLTFPQSFPSRSVVISSSNLVLEIRSQSSAKIPCYFLVSLNRTHRYLFEFTTPAVQCTITAQRPFLRCSFRALNNTSCIRFSF
jgi:hypothetical protein